MVTFPKGQLPPVHGFWSLTMYNPEHVFYPNAMNRFALGTKNKTLKYNPDGSLTIYLGHESPGMDHWLLVQRDLWFDTAPRPRRH